MVTLGQGQEPRVSPGLESSMETSKREESPFKLSHREGYPDSPRRNPGSVRQNFRSLGVDTGCSSMVHQRESGQELKQEKNLGAGAHAEAMERGC